MTKPEDVVHAAEGTWKNPRSLWPRRKPMKNKMGPIVGKIFHQFLIEAKVDYWQGTARDARDQLQKALPDFPQAQRLFVPEGGHKYPFAESLQRFGLAFYSGTQTLRKEGWTVGMFSIPGIGYHYEITRKVK